MADDEDKPSNLRVVSDNPTARADRQTEWAIQQAQNALSQFAAALLRTMAGNDTEAVYLIRRLSHFIEALNEFREKSGRGLSIAELQEALCLPHTELDTSDDEDWRYRHWLRENGLETIVKGALRLAAHKVLGEEPAFGGMHSERLIERGIKSLEELKRPRQPRSKPLTQKSRGLAHGWDDMDAGQAKTKSPAARQFGERLGGTVKSDGAARRKTAQSFSEDDLKELRKAIKAKDGKRIAELTSKIGKPSFDK